jgi:hypothetical protein
MASPRPKNDLEHVSEKFDKEIAAVASCTFVALLVDVASQLLTSSMTSTDESSLSNSVKSFNTYATNVLAMTPQLIRQSCRLACTHAISAKDVIFQIICVGSTWEDDDIHEYSNSYVEDLHEKMSEIWGIMSTSSSLPYPLLKYSWDQLVRSAFHTLIEGFSKVTNCSTGGRSFMSMDLNTLSDGLNPDTVKRNLSDAYPTVISPPSSSYRGEGKQYVDAYIKVFFYPDEVRFVDVTFCSLASSLVLAQIEFHSGFTSMDYRKSQAIQRRTYDVVGDCQEGIGSGE